MMASNLPERASFARPGEFKGAGGVDNGDVRRVDAVALQCVDGAVFEMLYHKAIPAAHQEGVAALAVFKITFDFVHVVLSINRINFLSAPLYRLGAL